MVRPLLWLKKIKESSTVTKNFRYLCRKFFVTVLTGKLRGGCWPEQANERETRDFNFRTVFRLSTPQTPRKYDRYKEKPHWHPGCLASPRSRSTTFRLS